MGKGQFKIRLRKKSNRELNPVEQYRRKQKETVKLRRLVNRLSHRDSSPPRRPKRHSDDEDFSGTHHDPMLGELLTTNRLREDEGCEDASEPDTNPPTAEQRAAPKESASQAASGRPVQRASYESLVPTSVAIPHAPLPPKPQAAPQPSESGSEEEDIEALNLSRYELTIPLPPSHPQPTTTTKQQPSFRRMLDEDKDISDFYAHISDLL